jgi:peptide/nickel transport system substrate-binding protein
MVMPDTDAQYAALLAGEIDVLDTRSNVDQYNQLVENDAFSTFVYPQLVYDYWHWNLREERFQDVLVRKAMCHAINRQEMIDNVLLGLGELTNGPTNPLRWDWDDSLNEIHPSYDPEKTVMLMEEAGWTIDKNDDGSLVKDAVWTKMGSDGEEMRMEFEIAHNTPNPRRRDFSLIIQNHLSKLGFKTNVNPMETNAFYNDYLQGSNDFQTAIAGWRMGTDPDGTSIWHTDSLDPNGFNWHAYSNPEVDRLLEEALPVAEVEAARPLYQAINKLLVEDMGYCWLAFPSATFAARPDLDGAVQWSPLNPYSHLTEWFWQDKGVPVTVME